MAQQSALRNEQKETDSEMIENVRCAITNGHCSNGELVAFVLETYKASRSKVRAVLERYEGSLWLVEKGINNKSTYHLNTAPAAPVHFF
jgi:DNA-binding transcriptional regulator PaaX